MKFEEDDLMKDHYEFSAAEKGKYYRPVEELDIPIYLEEK